MKKTISILLIALFVFAFINCGGGGAEAAMEKTIKLSEDLVKVLESDKSKEEKQKADEDYKKKRDELQEQSAAAMKKLSFEERAKLMKKYMGRFYKLIGKRNISTNKLK